MKVEVACIVRDQIKDGSLLILVSTIFEVKEKKLHVPAGNPPSPEGAPSSKASHNFFVLFKQNFHIQFFNSFTFFN